MSTWYERLQRNLEDYQVDELVQMAVEELYATGQIADDLLGVLTNHGLCGEVLEYCEGFLGAESELYRDAVAILVVEQQLTRSERRPCQ